jgi:hypothetical protein
MGRILAETGLFYMQSYMTAHMVIVALFGAKALGPETALLLMLVSSVLTLDPRESLMPFTVNSMKLADLNSVNVGRTALPMVFAILLGLAIVIPVQLYTQYDRGYNVQDWWAWNAPKQAYTDTVTIKQRLKAQGALEDSLKIHGWQRFLKMNPNPQAMAGIGAGLFLVLLFTFLRMRLPKWPLHPVMFLYWATWPALCFFFSFFLGWVIKALTMRFGGVGFFQRMKPLMIGLIAGELVAALLISAFGWIYYSATGLPPKSFFIFPG